MTKVVATICICHSPFMDFDTLSLADHGIILNDIKYAKKNEHYIMYTLRKISKGGRIVVKMFAFGISAHTAGGPGSPPAHA